VKGIDSYSVLGVVVKKVGVSRFERHLPRGPSRQEGCESWKELNVNRECISSRRSYNPKVQVRDRGAMPDLGIVDFRGDSVF